MTKDIARTAIRIPESLFEKLKNLADTENCSISEQVNQILKEEVNKFEHKHGEIIIDGNMD